MSTLKQTLADKGFKLRRVIHMRNIRQIEGSGVKLPPFAPDFGIKALNLGYMIEPRGGSTIVSISDNSGKVLSAVAECHHKDGYNKKAGAKIAAERAMEMFKI